MRESSGYPGLFEVAAEWALIAELLRYPDEGFENRIRVATLLVEDPELLTACGYVRREVNPTTYGCFFGREGEISLVESTYRSPALAGGIRRDLESSYLAFGFDAGVEEVDHVSNIAGFVGHLKHREGLAHVRRGRREVTQLRVAAQQVIRGHLWGFVEPLAEKLDATEILYLAHTGHALLQRCGVGDRAEVSRAGLLRARKI